MVTDTDDSLPDQAFGTEPTLEDELEPSVDEDIVEEPLAALDDLDRIEEPSATDTEQDLSDQVFGAEPTLEDEPGTSMDEDIVEEPLTALDDLDALDEPLVTDTDNGLPDEELVSDPETDSVSDPSLADTIEESFEFSEADRNILTKEFDDTPEPDEAVTDAVLNVDTDAKTPSFQTSSFPKAAFLDTTDAMNLDTDSDDDFIESLGMTIEAKEDAFVISGDDTPDEMTEGISSADDQPEVTPLPVEPATDIEPQSDKFDESAQALPADAITSGQLELALENVIKKMFSDKIETILHDVIEKTVTNEIDRLKKLLLEDSGDDL